MDDPLDALDLGRAAEAALGHRPRRVDDEHDVDALGHRLGVRVHDLWTCERDDEEGERQDAERDEQPAQPHA